MSVTYLPESDIYLRFIQRFYEGRSKFDVLSRKEEEKPMMLKLSTAPEVSGNETQVTYPMVPGGAATEVNETNQVRYLDLWLRHKLESEIDEGSRWFAQGLTSVVPPGVLNMFTAKDLQRLLGGDALDDDSLEDLFRHVRYHAPGGQAGKDRLQAQFEAAMREFAPEERQAMFRFVTSLDRLPPGGCSSLDPPFTVEIDTRASKTSAHFPEAQTCMNHVLAPSYPDAETMMARLRTAAKDGLEYHYEY